jgi:hypothetical protein
MGFDPMDLDIPDELQGSLRERWIEAMVDQRARQQMDLLKQFESPGETYTEDPNFLIPLAGNGTGRESMYRHGHRSQRPCAISTPPISPYDNGYSESAPTPSFMNSPGIDVHPSPASMSQMVEDHPMPETEARGFPTCRLWMSGGIIGLSGWMHN